MSRSRTVLLFALLLLAATAFCQQAGAPWPKFRGNSLNTGAAGVGGSNGLLRWTATTAGYIDSSPAVGSDKTIYVGSSDGNLYAINPDGSVKWTFPTQSGIESSPLIGPDGTIFVGSDDFNFYAVKPDGTQRWVFPTNGQILGSPAIDSTGTNIYIGSGDGNLYAITIATGIQSWVYSAGDGSVITSSPAIGPNGAVYFGSTSYAFFGYIGGYLTSLSSSGALQWSFSMPDGTSSTPALGPDGTIYIGSADGALYAVNPDGSYKWEFDTFMGVASSPAIGPNGTIYFSSVDLYAVNPDGSLKWSYAMGGLSADDSSSPAVGADGTVYAKSSEDFLFAVNPTRGPIWSIPTGTTGLNTYPWVSSPAIGADGTVYVGGSDGLLYAVGTQSNTDAIASVTLNPSSVTGGLTSKGTVNLAVAALAGGNIVTLSSNSASATVPAFVIVPANAKSASFTVTTSAVTNSTSADISASSGGRTAKATLAITNVGQLTLTVSPASTVGGLPSIGTVAMNAQVLTDTVVSLSSNSIIAGVPAQVVIHAGSSSANFTVTTVAVGTTETATITATQGSLTASATLTLSPPTVQGLTVSPTLVIGGNTSTGTVTLTSAAPSAGLAITLTSSSGSASVPVSTTVPGGSTTGTFTISTTGVSSQTTSTITAALGISSASAVLTVQPPTLTSLSVSPTSVLGGQTSTGKVMISGIAPSGGLNINLSSNGASVTLPGTVQVAGGASSATFTITTTKVTASAQAVITATLGSVNETATLTIQPLSLQSVTVSPSSFVGGSKTTVSGVVSLNGPAATTGATVTLTSSNPRVLTVPASVKIMSGLSTANFAVGHHVVTAPTTVVITAKYNGVVETTSVTVNPFQVVSFTISPTSVIGGTSASGTITLNAAPGTGPVVVSLKSSAKAVVPPATVSVTVGATSAKVTVKTTKVTASTTGTVTATLGSSTQQASLTVTQ